MNKEVVNALFWRGWRAGFLFGLGAGILIMGYIKVVTS